LNFLKWPSKRKGILVLIGGAEDRRGDRAVLKRVVSFTPTRRVSVITTASDFPVDLGKDYQRVFASLGVTQVDVLDIRYREEADHHPHLSSVQKADVIFFTGGDQVQLVETLDGTSLLGRIRKRLHEGVTVAGTSAGAASSGEVTIYSGDGEGLLKGAIGHRKAFGFLKGIVVDTHFVERARLPRLAQYLSSGQIPVGLGLAEDTAAIVYPDQRVEVIGRGLVTAVSADGAGCSTYRDTAARDPITVDGLRLSYLAPGTWFDLVRWAVLPGVPAVAPVPASSGPPEAVTSAEKPNI